jgi:hypothetical protein
MDGLNDYQRSFARKEGVFETIGLDIHASETDHPFSVRKSLPINALVGIQNALTNRQNNLKSLANQLNWEYLSKIDSNPRGLNRFLFFESKVINYSLNKLKNKKESSHVFDLSFSEGAFITKEDLKATFLLFKSPVQLPVFVLDKEDLRTTLYQLAGLDDINFDKYPDFSKRFHLSGNDRPAIRKVFTPNVIFFFESHPFFHIESNGNHLLIKGKDRLSSIQEIKLMLSFAEDLNALLKKEMQPKS